MLCQEVSQKKIIDIHLMTFVIMIIKHWLVYLTQLTWLAINIVVNKNTYLLKKY